MSTFQMPSELSIVAIGGCGKKLVYNLCEHEWFLKNCLEENRSLKIYVMDTDSNEVAGDRERTKAVNDTINKMKTQMKGEGGTIAMEYYYLPDLASTNRVSDLTGTSVVHQVKNCRNPPRAEVWWMNDPDNGISYDDLKKIDDKIIDDFGGGVHRRRAISKAVFYKAISQSGDTSFPNFPGQGDIALVVGLGGGTGSGMFIDLARYIKGKSGNARKIWLFGVMPTIQESEKEQLNAGIALSEIEYLNITGERLFNYCILSSLGPTGYTGGSKRLESLMDYDNAFPYILINAFYLPTADCYDIIDARKDYSGFIFADAHVIEYPVEELRYLKVEFEGIIRELSEVGKNRRLINEKISEVLRQIEYKHPEQLCDEGGIITTGEDLAFVKNEIKKLAQIWSNEIPKLLNYHTYNEIESLLLNNLPADIRNLNEIKRYDQLIEYAYRLRSSIDISNQPLEDENDKVLYSNIKEYLIQIENLAILQKDILRIRESEFLLLMKKVLWGEEDLSHVLNLVNSKNDSLTGEVLELKQKIAADSSELDTIKSGKEDIIENVKSACYHAKGEIEDFIIQAEKINSIAQDERDLVTEINDLGLRLQDLMNELLRKKQFNVNRRTWNAKAECIHIIQKIDALIQSGNLSTNLQYLRNFVEALVGYYYYEYKKESSQKIGLIGRLLGAKPNLQLIEANLKTKMDIMIGIGERERDKLIVREPLDYEVVEGSITRSLVDDLKSQKNRIIDSIVLNELKHETGDYSSLVGAFESSKPQTVMNNLIEGISTILIQKNNYDEEISELSRTIAETSVHTRKLQDTLATVHLYKDLVNDTLTARRLYNEHSKKIEKSLSNIDIKQEGGGSTIRRLYYTRYGGIDPAVLSLIRDDSNLGVLDKRDEGIEEITRVSGLVRETYRKMIESSLLGINNFSIGYGPSQTESWSFEKAALVISSPSQLMTDTIANTSESICTTIASDIYLDSRRDAKVVTYNYGKPWEVGLTFFTASSFLDNISPLITGRGYWSEYERGRHNILHHVLSLQNGKYIVRKSLMSLEMAAEIADAERNENDANRGSAKRRVLELYDEIDIKEAFHK